MASVIGWDILCLTLQEVPEVEGNKIAAGGWVYLCRLWNYSNYVILGN